MDAQSQPNTHAAREGGRALPRLSGMNAEPVPVVDATTHAILDALPFTWLVVQADFRVVDSARSAFEFDLGDRHSITEPAVRRLVTGALRTGESDEIDIELRGTIPGALSRHIRVRACPLGSTCALLIEDVSQALRLDAMRRDFIVNVSHELKTPVGALVLLAEAVKSSEEDPDTQQRFVARMQTEAERLSRLVNDLSDLSRLQASEMPVRGNDIPVARIVAEAIDTVKLIASARDTDLVSGNCKGLRVEGDEEQLVTALRNLLTNAIAYSPSGTRVAVAARRVDGLVEISVTDQGIGISDTDLERIFERFYRVDPARSRETGGTGLGLAIVKHICAAHGGECTVWSKVGEGSTFTLRLPSAR